MNPYISIVTGTVNRLHFLKPMVWSVRQAVGEHPYEIVLVDGGSRDGTVEWCKKQPDVKFIQQGKRLGGIIAFNAGFFAATGKFVVNMNDDCYITPGTLAAACRVLEDRPEVGQVALQFGSNDKERLIRQARILDGKIYIYANFGVTRKWLGDKVGWWGRYLFHYGGDAECSMMIWDAGYQVVPLWGEQHHVYHYYAQDETRQRNYDSSEWTRKWNGWTGPPDKPRFEEGK